MQSHTGMLRVRSRELVPLRDVSPPPTYCEQRKRKIVSRPLTGGCMGVPRVEYCSVARVRGAYRSSESENLQSHIVTLGRSVQSSRSCQKRPSPTPRRQNTHLRMAPAYTLQASSRGTGSPHAYRTYSSISALANPRALARVGGEARLRTTRLRRLGTPITEKCVALQDQLPHPMPMKTRTSGKLS